MSDDKEQNSIPGRLHLAREYLKFAEEQIKADNFGIVPPYSPLLQVTCIGVELVMKSDLKMQGVADLDLSRRPYGHNIKHMFGKIDERRKVNAEKAARRALIEKVRGYRDTHLKAFGDYGNIAREFGEVPSNEEIGNMLPKTSACILAVYPTYARNHSLRYFRTSYGTIGHLQFSPWSMIYAMVLIEFGKQMANCIDDAFRTLL